MRVWFPTWNKVTVRDMAMAKIRGSVRVSAQIGVKVKA